ncbi:putative glycosidase CRH2 [Coemansia biformis]|uniref:Glycosidase CRH2 n=1 Tax=Coemansia biformis TaxID=1286918 RepID=A0A9W8CY46_9FUNG|nr:putative glycosidase CRH2 [Coemansia biformis]
MYCMDINCEPQNSFSESSCWGRPHCVESSVDFGGHRAFADIAAYNGDPATAAFVSQFEPSNARIGGDELQLELVKQGDGKGFGATVIGTRAIQYGTVTTVMRSGCAAAGVVSSFIIRNDKIGDEIDFEFVGKDTSTVQSNYYWHNQLDYTKMVTSPPMSDTTKNFHTYQIQWTPDQIVWLVDGAAFRTVKRSDTWDPALGTFKYPDSEAYVSYSIWDGGAGAQGTSEWAGGATRWGQGPFVASVKSIDISCYYKGNETTYTPPGGSSSEDRASRSDKSSVKSDSRTGADADQAATSDDSDDAKSERESERSGLDESAGDGPSDNEPSDDASDARRSAMPRAALATLGAALLVALAG